MKKWLKYLFGILFLAGPSCEMLQHHDPEVRLNAVFIDEILFSECVANDTLGFGTIAIESRPYNYLLFHTLNTEFCCETDSILLGVDQSEDAVDIEIYDMGPYSYCFCDHDLYFTLGPFKEKTYTFRIIESVNAYYRDTFLFTLDLTRSIDTVIFPIDTSSIISPADTITPPDTTITPPPNDTTLTPPHLINTFFGGCNIDSTYRGMGEPDISSFRLEGDTAVIFAGFNYQCCAPFTSTFRYEGGKIILRLKDNCTQPYSSCYCKCNCYYTFEFRILLTEPFRVYPYVIYVDDPKHGGEYLFWSDFISGPVNP